MVVSGQSRRDGVARCPDELRRRIGLSAGTAHPRLPMDGGLRVRGHAAPVDTG